MEFFLWYHVATVLLKHKKGSASYLFLEAIRNNSLNPLVKQITLLYASILQKRGYQIYYPTVVNNTIKVHNKDEVLDEVLEVPLGETPYKETFFWITVFHEKDSKTRIEVENKLDMLYILSGKNPKKLIKLLKEEQLKDKDVCRPVG